MNPVEFMHVFEEFRAASWDAWRRIIERLTPSVREFFAICGRGSGKSRIVALLATFFASREYARAPGEYVFIGVFGPDRKQAAITFKYVVGLMRSVPSLSALIVAESKDSIELSNGVIVEVITASIAAPRGRAYGLAIVEEAAFLPTDASANPDTELLRAVRPALARVPGSLLCVVSSPYARRGVLWDAWRKYHDEADGAVVFVQQPTSALNPLFDPIAIETAYAEDPASASAEYGALFRTDVESFVSQEAIAACIVAGRLELAPRPAPRYRAFLDFAGGSGADSATWAIAHDEKGRVVLDVVRERRPPFSPEDVCERIAADCKRYGLATAVADRFAGQFPVEKLRKLGITVTPSERSKSDIYRDFLPALNSGCVELLDVPRLHAQLAGLERRTARGGRDSIDHAPGGHDDLINAAAGALTLVAATKHVVRGCTWGDPTVGYR